jgi:hypothetical protein
MPNRTPESSTARQITLRRYFARVILFAVGFGALFGIFLALLRQQNLWSTFAYTISISISCWFYIDLGRFVLARWVHRRDRAATGEVNDWPGWPLMLGVLILGSALGFSTGNALGDWITGSRSSNLLSAANLRDSLSLLLMALVPAVVVTYFFYSRGMIADREAAAQSAQRQAAESQLKLLESQLEPHMLFNTLANLRALIALDPPRAQAMLDQLIAFLRATLNGSRSAQHSLRAEFARLDDYLALMQVRMADRLSVHFDLPAALAETPIAPLLLQPLVENSIKHGLEPAVAGGRIDISAAREGAELILRVRDTGLGFEAGIDGFGLSQVRERLGTMYGARASLQIASAPDADGGTLAVIRLPLSDA